MNHQLIEKKANEFRSSIGLTPYDPVRLKSVLTKLNVLTVYKTIFSDISGMAIKVKKGHRLKRFILINAAKSRGHQHFTICHELSHLFIQADFKFMICSAGKFEKKHKEEYNADTFAAYFLMPSAGIESLIPDEEFGRDKITLKTLLKIEQYFSCSRTVLLFRLQDLQLLSAQAVEHFKQHVQRNAVQHGYAIDLYQPGNENQVIGDYGTLARELYDRELISESHYYSLLLDLGMNVEELEKLGNEETSPSHID